MTETATDLFLAQPDDLDALVGILTQQFSEHTIAVSPVALAHAVAAALRDDRLGFFIGARDGKDWLGCAYVSFTWALEHAGKSAWLEELYVVPNARSGGIGARLLTRAIDEARAAGCAAVDLEVDQEHLRAENLYERHGFARLPRRRWVRARLQEGTR